MNRENYKEVLAQIESDPRSWDQKVWHRNRGPLGICGSAHCFAGWAEILSGHKADYRTAAFHAQRWLEISDQEATYLFAVERTLKDFHKFLEAHPEDVSAKELEALVRP